MDCVHFQCLINTWYVSADMQLYLIAPFLVYLVHRFKAKALIAFLVLILAGCWNIIALHVKNNLRDLYVHVFKSMHWILSIKCNQSFHFSNVLCFFLQRRRSKNWIDLFSNSYSIYIMVDWFHPWIHFGRISKRINSYSEGMRSK